MYIQILSANMTVPKLLCNYFLWKMLIIELWFSPFLGKRQISFVFLCVTFTISIYTYPLNVLSHQVLSDVSQYRCLLTTPSHSS